MEADFSIDVVSPFYYRLPSKIVFFSRYGNVEDFTADRVKPEDNIFTRHPEIGGTGNYQR